MTTIDNIYDLLHLLFDVLSDEYTEKVINGEYLNDTIKVTKQGSTNAMYIGFDLKYPDVINATVYDEPENYDERDDCPVAEGIFWDTEDPKLTPETIAADIKKYL